MKILVTGAAGTIGHQLVKRLKKEGHWVRGVDIIYPEFSDSEADQFIIADMRDPEEVSKVMFAPDQQSITDYKNSFDEVYCLCAQMGGAEYIFSGKNDAIIMHDSVLMNANSARYASLFNVKKLFFSSSACVYPESIQSDVNNPGLKESDAWKSHPDSVYGIEKLFSEKIYDAYHRNYGLDIRIGRFHNIYSTECHYKNGREKAPAAMCRKAATAVNPEGLGCRNFVDVFGDGLQTRSFLYIEDCLDAVRLLMDSTYNEPVNIGSEEMVSINDLAKLTIELSGKKLMVNNVHSDVLGVRGRNSDNTLARIVLNGWEPKYSLKDGMTILYSWVNKQVNGK